MDEWSPDPTAAVVAHGLLNSMAIISGAAHTLAEAWDNLDGDRRRQLLNMIGDQAEHVSELLGDLARGLPPGVRYELDSLTEAHSQDAPR
ncbi:MAG TPA: histidine kinase dimerization/phospho-acceptor domain-containing protein [Acidimicrobiales bacterium]|nr:histidine kinase dimerization/phospho-acceptor domain-containing protein [Acidimicrobiales bacterium]